MPRLREVQGQGPPTGRGGRRRGRRAVRPRAQPPPADVARAGGPAAPPAAAAPPPPCRSALTTSITQTAACELAWRGLVSGGTRPRRRPRGNTNLWRGAGTRVRRGAPYRRTGVRGAARGPWGAQGRRPRPRPRPRGGRRHRPRSGEGGARHSKKRMGDGGSSHSARARPLRRGGGARGCRAPAAAGRRAAAAGPRGAADTSTNGT
jgi:hypothetical protein